MMKIRKLNEAMINYTEKVKDLLNDLPDNFTFSDNRTPGDLFSIFKETVSGNEESSAAKELYDELKAQVESDPKYQTEIKRQQQSEQDAIDAKNKAIEDQKEQADSISKKRIIGMGAIAEFKRQ